MPLRRRKGAEAGGETEAGRASAGPMVRVGPRSALHF